MTQKLFLVLAFFGLNFSFAQPTISSTIYQGTTANPATVSAGAVLTHVIEIDNTAGVAPSSTVDLTGTISGPHTLMGTTGTQGWSSLSAWGSGTGPATAQWNNLTPTIGGDMIPVFGQNRFHGQANILVGNISTGSGGDGYSPYVHIRPDSHIWVIIIHHHEQRNTLSEQVIKCYDITNGTDCSGSANIPLDFKTVFRTKPYYHNGKLYYGIAGNTSGHPFGLRSPALGCIDLTGTALSDCFSPIGYTNSIIEEVSGDAMMSNVVIMQNNQAHAAYKLGDGNFQHGCIDLNTQAPCTGYPYYKNGMYDASDMEVLKLSDTKLAIATDASTRVMCLQVGGAGAPTLNCDGSSSTVSMGDNLPTSPIDYVNLYNNYMTNKITPKLNSTGNVVGYCAGTWCYDDVARTVEDLSVPYLVQADYYIDSIKARVYYAYDTDPTHYDKFRCFDFTTNTLCPEIDLRALYPIFATGSGDGHRPYGMHRIPGTECLVTYEHGNGSGPVTPEIKFLTDGGSGIITGCKFKAISKWDVSNPATRYCGPNTSSSDFAWDKIDVSNMPSAHDGGSLLIYNAADVLVHSTSIAPNATSFTYPPLATPLESLVPYATNPGLKIKLQLNGLLNANQIADIYLSYNVVGNKKPQFCFQSVVNCGAGIDTTGVGMAPLELQNHITLSGGASVTGESPNMTTFVTGSDCILPIEWGGFSIKIQDGLAYLNWTTLSEQNNKGFEVERSGNGSSFEKIGFVAGKGNSTTAQSYQFIDYDFSDKAYYRLKQIDLDGKSQYSKIVELMQNVTNVRLYPNPTQGIFNLEVSTTNNTRLEVLNSLGETIHSQEVNDYLTTIDLSSFSAGVYFVEVKMNESVQRIRLVKN